MPIDRLGPRVIPALFGADLGTESKPVRLIVPDPEWSISLFQKLVDKFGVKANIPAEINAHLPKGYVEGRVTPFDVVTAAKNVRISRIKDNKDYYNFERARFAIVGDVGYDHWVNEQERQQQLEVIKTDLLPRDDFRFDTAYIIFKFLMSMATTSLSYNNQSNVDYWKPRLETLSNFFGVDLSTVTDFDFNKIPRASLESIHAKEYGRVLDINVY